MNLKSLKFFNKFFNILINISFICAVFFVIIFLILPLFNIRNYEILSGSMEPTIKTGSLVISNNNVDVNDLKENDILVFSYHNENVVHRIVNIDSDKKIITTKGDANEIEDFDPVFFNNAIGKVVFKSYILGRLAAYLSTTVNKLTILIFFLFVFIIKAAFSANISELEVSNEQTQI